MASLPPKTVKTAIPPILSLAFGLALSLADSSYARESPQEHLTLARNVCKNPQETPTQLLSHTLSEKEIIVRGSRLGVQKLFTSENSTFEVDVIEPDGRTRRTALTTALGNDINQPDLWMILDSDCNLVQAKRITYSENKTPLYIQTLDSSFNPLLQKEWLNPPLPKKGRRDGLRVALIDSGVNYQLDEIANSLALDNNGEIVGYDYWDNDNTPFDANLAQSVFFIQRHGTRTASILLREAPGIALVPYRYPRPDMSRMRKLVEHATANNVRIIGMPLGSNNSTEWQAFSTAVTAHGEILFIVSAGNNGRNIDDAPVYPAALTQSNIIVVSSSNDFIKPAERTNYGKQTVDYLLPAEKIAATDFDGSAIEVSGSSYAVSRLTALAARLLSGNPDMTVEQLKSKISTNSVKGKTDAYVSTGYIGNPIGDTADISSELDNSFAPLAATPESNTKIALNLVALGTSWSTDKIVESLMTANKTYQQCGMTLVANSLIRVRAPSYLENLSPGNALTLGQHLADRLKPDTITIYFATDTDMQTKFDAEAFGEGNTGTRRWMRNTLWVTAVTPDTGDAVAHEIFHILTNSGQHSTRPNNLMQMRTSPENSELAEEQCQAAIETPKANRLIK